MAHINSILPDTLYPLQFAYSLNRSTDDAISIKLHTAFSHLDKRNTYVRILFIDYSSAFTTIVPTTLITKLRTVGLNTSLYNWILNFLTGWCVRPSTSLGPSFLPSRTYIIGGVRGKPIKLSE